MMKPCRATVRIAILMITFLILTRTFLYDKRSNMLKIIKVSNIIGATSKNLFRSLDVNVEKKIRNGITEKNWALVRDLVGSLNSTMVSSKRNVVYVIAETCRRTNNFKEIVPLLESLPFELQFLEDDILPLLKATVNDPRLFKSVQPIINYFHDKRMVFSARVYTLLMKGYAKQRNELMIDSLLELCERNLVTSDTIFFNSVLNAYFKCGSYAKALYLISRVVPETVSIFPGLFRKYKTPSILSTATINRLNYVLSFPNIQITLQGINIFLAGLKPFFRQRSARLQQCLDYLHTVSREYSIPYYDNVTYNTLIDLVSTTNDVFLTRSILIKVNTTLGIEAYTSFLRVLSKQGKIHQTYETLEQMLQNGMVINEITMTTVITALIQASQFEQAKELLRTDNRYLQAMLEHCTTNGQRKELLSIVHSAYISGICSLGLKSLEIDHWQNPRDDAALSRLLFSYKLLVSAITQLLAMSHQSLLPSPIAINSMMFFASKIYSPTRIIELLYVVRYYQTQGVTLDQYSYSILMSALGREKNPSVHRLFQQLSDNQLLNIQTINAYLKSFDYTEQYSEGIIFGYKYLMNTSASSLRHRNTMEVSEVPTIRTFHTLFTLLEKYLIVEDPSWQEKKKQKGDSSLRDDLKNFNLSKNHGYVSLHLTERKSFQQLVVSNSNSGLKQLLNQLSSHINSAKQSVATSALAGILLPLIQIDLPSPSVYQSTSDDHSISNTAREFIQNQTVDKIVYNLYRLMRSTYQIPLDMKMVIKFDRFFSLIQQQRSDWFIDLSSFLSIDDGLTFLDQHHTIHPRTARYIFEDLVLQGYDPVVMNYILNACRYSPQKRQQFSDLHYLQQFRANRESYRIFLNHNWNDINSGWKIL